jgi:hypothetical protein
VQIRLPAVEPDINAVAATILGKPGMKRLMDVAERRAKLV